MLTAKQRWKQARVKMRLIAAREMQDWMSGKIDLLPGCTDERTILDAIETAYKSGRRDAFAEHTKGSPPKRPAP